MNNNKLHFITTLLIILLSCISCNTLFEKDHSLKPEEYQKLGMPDHTKIWTNDDYVNSNITLSSLKVNYPLSLPRKNSRKSGKLFKRMVSAENLAFINDTVIPLRNRAYTIQYFTRFMSEMEQMYRVDYKGKMYYMEELSDLNIFGLVVHNKMLELAWIIMKSNDPDVSGIQSGLPSVKYNYIKLIPRLLAEFVNADQYPIDGLEDLSKAISASVIINSEWMTMSDKNYLSSELKNAIEKSRSSEIRNNLESALKVLK